MYYPRLSKIIYTSLILIIIIQVFGACTSSSAKKDGQAIARANGEYLYSAELEGMIPPGTPKADSIELVRNFINTWVRQKLIVHLAEKNLDKEDKDFSQEIETYKNSLIVYRFQEQLVKQKLDTVVTETEIETYYNGNQSDFELKDNIVKVIYVKLPLKSPQISQIKSLMRSDRERDKLSLAKLCDTYAANSSLDQQNWLLFNDLLKEIPIKTYDQEAFLQNNRFLEIKGEEFIYLVYFTDFKIKESISPLSFEKENIRNVILNKRKLNLISEMEKEVYDKALKNKDFEIL
jgi:hypothetical protein